MRAVLYDDQRVVGARERFLRTTIREQTINTDAAAELSDR
jgi:hypothetical protein